MGPNPDHESTKPYDTEAYAAPSAGELLAEIATLEGELAARTAELQLARAEILERERELEESDENAPLGYLRMDVNGVITGLNNNACLLLDRRRTSLLGRPVTSIAAESSWRTLVDHLTEARQAEKATTAEVDLRRVDGTTVPVALYTRRLSGMSQLRAAVVDLRERRRAEQEKAKLEVQEQAARAISEAKDHFLAVLSHELRTPLTPVLAAVSDLSKSPEIMPPEVYETVEMVRKNVLLEVRLIDDLLDLTRVSRGKLELRKEPLDLNELVTEVLAICRPDADNAGVTLTADLSAHDSGLSGDATRLRQVLWNMVKNAIKYTDRGGKVSVMTTNRSRQFVEVTVKDDGLGIEPEDLNRLFTPFTQGTAGRQRGGLGLGLALSRKITEAHGGTLSADSQGAGQGSTFTLRLPAGEPPRAAKEPAPKRPSNKATRSRSILLVEDHRDTALVLSKLLRKRGHTVACAGSVAEAIDMAADNVGGFDLLISDFGLPDGNGADVMHYWTAHWGEIDGVVLSGYGSEEDVARSIAAGFRRHIVKPVDFDRLMEAVEEPLD
ncbi:MAG: ATP-binding protein [Phycisphaerae bacterium]